MKERGPFTFASNPREADALLTLNNKIPGGAKRGLLGKSPQVSATLTTTDGLVLWHGQNKYKKSTTLWGGSTDIECGLANGLVDRLVKAIKEARP
jgi:hypothetical protein